MNITTQTTAMKDDRGIHTARQTAIIIGVFFILAAVTAILGLIFYSSILGGPDYLRNGAEA